MKSNISIFTAGYQGRTIGGFVKLLQDYDIDVLVDVRLTPISRKKGFSKNALQSALAEAGILYQHEKQLGNPKEIRMKAESSDECLALYSEHMADKWTESLAPLIEKVSDFRICLLCMEYDSGECHRSIVAEEMANALPGAKVVHL